MPFRDRTLSKTARRWLLPGYVGLSVVAILVWTIWVLLVVSAPTHVPKPGESGVNASEALFIAGLAGLGLLIVLGISVAVVLFETTAYESRLFVGDLVLLSAKAAKPAEPSADAGSVS